MIDPATRYAEVKVRVPFHDLDPAGIVWHGHYAKYFELARCELLRSFGYNYDDMVASGYSWPVIDLRARYVEIRTVRAGTAGSRFVARMGVPLAHRLPDQRRRHRRPACARAAAIRLPLI